MPRLLLALAALLLSACTAERVHVAAAAQAQLVGMTKPQLQACMARPHTATTDGEAEIWSFDSAADSHGRTSFGAPPGAGSLPNSAWQANATTFDLGRLRQKSCIVHVVLVDGAVERVDYLGSSGNALVDIDRCAPMVENCVR